jgi:aspartate aminotransferase
MDKSFLASRLNAFAESQTLAMATKSRELKAKGIEVINLNLGEPDFVTPDYICKAAQEAIDSGVTFYPPVAGFMELRKAIAAKLLRENGLNYAPENIIVSTGAKQTLANIFYSLINPGDEVIILTPYWVTYIEQVRMMEGVPVLVEGSIENDFKPLAADIAKAITPKTKALVFSSPCNPTGSVFSRQELQEIAEVCAPHELLIISDEIYEHINFVGKHESIAQFENVYSKTVVVNGFSKGYAMTGWRMGYMAGPLSLVKACEKVQGQFTSGACSISQKAAQAALEGPQEATQAMTQAYLRRRNLIKDLLDEVKGFKTNMPQGAFYIFPDVSELLGLSYQGNVMATAYDLSMFLLNEAHVSLVDGSAFGAPQCLRLSYATSDQNISRAIEQIGKAVAKLS